MKNFRSFSASASRVLAVSSIAALSAALALSSCSDNKTKSEGENGGSGDSTGNAGSGESGKAGTSNGTGGSGGLSGTGGSRNEGGSAGVPLNSGGSGGVATIEPAIPVVPDPAKDCGAASGGNVPALQLTPIVDGFTRPILVTQPHGETERLFVVEKPGTIKILRGSTIADTPFLDISDEVSEGSHSRS